jgi:hypothetical protein
MGEIEEIIAIEGLPALEKKDTDACCEHAPVEGFECEWLVERIILPELGAQGSEEGDEEFDEDSSQRFNEQLGEVAGAATTEQALAGEAGNMAMLALQLGFPILKPFLEEQVRRATITVRWKEGPRERGFDVIQYLVAEQPAAVDGTAADETAEEEPQ